MGASATLLSTTEWHSAVERDSRSHPDWIYVRIAALFGLPEVSPAIAGGRGTCLAGDGERDVAALSAVPRGPSIAAASARVAGSQSRAARLRSLRFLTTSTLHQRHALSTHHGTTGSRTGAFATSPLRWVPSR